MKAHPNLARRLPLLIPVSLGIASAQWNYLLSLRGGFLLNLGSLEIMAIAATIALALPNALRNFGHRPICRAIINIAYGGLILAGGWIGWTEAPSLVPMGILILLSGVFGSWLAQDLAFGKFALAGVLGWIFANGFGLPWVGLKGCSLANGTMALLGLVIPAEKTITAPSSDSWLARIVEGLLLAGLTSITWQRVNHIFPSQWLNSIFFGAAIGVALLVSMKRIDSFPDLAVSRDRAAIAAGASVITASLIPAMLTPGFYPIGKGVIQGFAMFATILILAAPSWGVLIQTRLARPFEKSYVLGMAIGALAVNAVSEHLSEAWLNAALAAVPIGFSIIGIQSRFRVRAALLAAGFLAVAWLSYTESLRYLAPADEKILETRREHGNVFAVTRSTSDGDLRLRRNFHQVAANLGSFKHMRRHTLLPLAIDPTIRRALIVGGNNAMGVSALMEQPLAEVTVLEGSASVLDFSRWFTSNEASQNPLTRLIRAHGDPITLLENRDRFYDAVILENRPPWVEGSNYLYSVDYLAAAQRRLYPRGRVVQWFALYQWSPSDLKRIFANWRQVFGKEFQVWRSDLMPEVAMIALISLPSIGGVQSHAETEPKRVPSFLQDTLLSSPNGLLSLWLGNADALDAEENLDAPIAPIEATRPDLEIRAARNRFFPENLIQSDYILRALARLSPEDGPAYGGLLWTRALQKFRRQDEGWPEDRAQATRILGFDPSSAYPQAFDVGAGEGMR